MNKIVILLFLFLSGNCFGWIEQSEKMLASKMRSYGGDIIDRRTRKGVFYVVNAQNSVNDAQLSEAVRVITRRLRIDAVITNGTFSFDAPVKPGTATLYIVESTIYPMSLVAVESRWALVNIEKLKTEKPAFFNARVTKEVYRTVAQLFGAFSSQFDMNIMGGVFSSEDLDQIATLTTPFEYRMRFDKYLPKMGFAPYKIVHYKKACTEGWAPAPTNRFQKAIWDKVHEVPKNPMKIEFDPKKGR